MNRGSDIVGIPGSLTYLFGDKDELAVRGSQFAILLQGSRAIFCGTSKGVVDSLGGSFDPDSGPQTGPLTYCETHDGFAELVSSMVTQVLHPLDKTSYLAAELSHANPAGSRIVAGVPSDCSSGTDAFSGGPLTICVASDNGYLTLVEQAGKGVFELVDKRDQVTSADFAPPPGVAMANGQ